LLRSSVDILRLLEQNPSTKNYQIQDYRRWSDGFYYKLTIHFDDGSELHAREYIDLFERDYSFHWQTVDGQLITRWDNAPHHRHIATYPHHKHTCDGIFENAEISLQGVIDFIVRIAHK